MSELFEKWNIAKTQGPRPGKANPVGKWTSAVSSISNNPEAIAKEFEFVVRQVFAAKGNQTSTATIEEYFRELIERLWIDWVNNKSSRASLQPYVVPVVLKNGTLNPIDMPELRTLILDNLNSIGELSQTLGFRFAQKGDPNSIAWTNLSAELGVLGGRPTKTNEEGAYNTVLKRYEDAHLNISGSFDNNKLSEYLNDVNLYLNKTVKALPPFKKFLLNFINSDPDKNHCVVLNLQFIRNNNNTKPLIYAIAPQEWNSSVTYYYPGKGNNLGIVRYNNKVYVISVDSTTESPENSNHWDELGIALKSTSPIIYKSQEAFHIALAHVFAVQNNLFDSLDNKDDSTLIPLLGKIADNLEESLGPLEEAANGVAIESTDNKAVKDSITSFRSLIKNLQDNIEIGKKIGGLAPKYFGKDTSAALKLGKEIIKQNLVYSIKDNKIVYGTPVNFVTTIVLSDEDYIQIVAGVDVSAQYTKINSGFQRSLEGELNKFMTIHIKGALADIFVKGHSPSLASRLVIKSLAKTFNEPRFSKTLKNSKKTIKTRTVLPLIETKKVSGFKKVPSVKKINKNRPKQTISYNNKTSANRKISKTTSIVDNLNRDIKNAVIAQMNPPALKNDSERFARSVKILDSRQQDIIRYTYMKRPYMIFSSSLGKKPWNSIPQRDPVKIINKAIRSLTGNKNIRTELS